MAETLTGDVTFRDPNLVTRATLDPDSNNLVTLQLGLGTGRPGMIVLRDGSQPIGIPIMQMEASTGHARFGNTGTAGQLFIRDSNGADVVTVLGQSAALFVGATGQEGDVVVRDGSGREVMHMNGQDATLYVGVTGNDGDVKMRDGAGRETIHLKASHAAVYVGTTGNEGDVIVRDDASREVIQLNGSNASLFAGVTGKNGAVVVRDSSSLEAIQLRAFAGLAVVNVGATGVTGVLMVRNTAGQEKIRLDGEAGAITFPNADCAEEFDISELEDVEPGTVMVLDDDGGLRRSTEAYDTRVAGVISGAGDWKPGIVLDKKNSTDNRMPLALLGKVLCKADAGFGAIEVGDLLTTSATPGHAIKADQPSRAFGAVLGKALRPLKEGKGLVLMLIALQ